MTTFAIAVLTLTVAQPPAAPKEVLSLQGHTMEVYALSLSPDGKRLASANNREVKIWDLVNGKELLNHPVGNSNVYGLAFHPDGKSFAVAVAKQVSIINASTGQAITTLPGSANYIFRLAFSPDGKYLAGAGGQNSTGSPGHVHVWNLGTGKEVFALEGHPEAVLCVGFSPDSRYLVSGCGPTSGVRAGDVRVWEMPTGRNVGVLGGHLANVYSVALSPDGRRVASGAGNRNSNNQGELKLWERNSAREVMKFEGHTGVVYGAAFSPDGRRLASASGDKTLRLWDVLTGKELSRVEAHSGIIYSLAFHPDGRRVITAGADRMVKVWDVGGPTAAVTGTRLTPEQLETCWKELAGDGGPAYRAVCSLVSAAEVSVPLLSKRLQPARDLDAEQKERAVRLVRDLDHRRYTTRESATRALSTMGEPVIPLLKKALEENPSLEMKKRATQVLDIVTGVSPSPEQVQALRAIEVLEHAGTAEARQLLEKMAAGLPGARLTEEARTALARVPRP